MREGPRDRLYRRGVSTLADGELLELLVGPHRRASERNKRCDDCEAGNASESLDDHAGATLTELARASPRELAQLGGIGRAGAARLAAAFELGRRAVEVAQHRTFVRTPHDVLALLGPRVAGLRQELFFAIGLDVRHHVLEIIEVARGTVTDVAVHPREVFRPLVRIAAAGAVLAHNHPSGDPLPSADDIELTRRLCAVGKIVGIPVLDHVVIGGNEMRSIAECGGDM